MHHVVHLRYYAIGWIKVNKCFVVLFSKKVEISDIVFRQYRCKEDVYDFHQSKEILPS